jgi:hypothetical protein
LRGRLVAPVTVWDRRAPAGRGWPDGLFGPGVEGQPARLLGLIDSTSAFWEAAREARALVVHVLAAGDRALAERFSEIRPRSEARSIVQADARGETPQFRSGEHLSSLAPETLFTVC